MINFCYGFEIKNSKLKMLLYIQKKILNFFCFEFCFVLKFCFILIFCCCFEILK